jgi:methylphosphotriester-DNA--protein-cysteine methyltransferase
MSYDRELLFAQIYSIISREPACSLVALSKRLAISKRTAELVVLAKTGNGFRALREATMIYSVRSLLRQDAAVSIKELSYSMGYKSPRSFARAVKRVCGVTPGQLRLLASQPLSITALNRSLQAQ